jgi:hypothetical protein
VSSPLIHLLPFSASGKLGLKKDINKGRVKEKEENNKRKNLLL